MNERLGPSLPQELPFVLGTITSFEWQNESQPVKFVETIQVAKGVECDTYDFINDQTKDLGIIKIQPDCKTPLQKVKEGEKTIEGYISGKGKLKVIRANGEKTEFNVGEISEDKLEITVYINDTMQWEADRNSNLIAYEICIPRYKEGRYENLKEPDSK